MHIPIYFLDNSWCFIEVTINSHGEVVVDWTELEKSVEEFVHQFSFNMPPSGAEMNELDRLLCASSMRKGVKGQEDINILCLHDKRYCYYNPSKKKIFEFGESINISMILNIRNFDMLDKLAKINNLEKYEVEFEIDS